MKTLRSKILVTTATAIGGLILYDISMQLVDAIYGIRERHPEMGIAGWLTLGFWFASSVALGVVGERVWGDRKLFIQGDVPFATVFFYMTISAFIYFFVYMRDGA